MFAYKYLILLCFIFSNIHLILSCGCYGSMSCMVNGTQCNHYSTPSSLCLCDCCPPCNTCEQLLQSNCLAHQYRKHYSLSPNQSTLAVKLNEIILPKYIIDQSNGEIVRYLWDPCLRRSLPRGIQLINDTDGSYQVTGTPREQLNETVFEILFKGPTNLLISVHFTLSIL